MNSCSCSPRSTVAVKQPARLLTVLKAQRRQVEANQPQSVPLQQVKLLGAAAAVAAALSLAGPALADFPGFKDILPGAGGIEKSVPNPGQSADMNAEDAEKTGAKPMGGDFEGPADSTPNIASKQTQVLPTGDEKKDRGNELKQTLSETDDSKVSDSMTGKALQ